MKILKIILLGLILVSSIYSQGIFRRTKALEDTTITHTQIINQIHNLVDKGVDSLQAHTARINTIETNLGTTNQNVTTLQNTVSSLSPPTVLTLTSDKPTGANVTPIVVTDLVFSYAANSKYKIELFALVQPTAATTGCGFQFDLSSAVTRIGFEFFHQLANAGTLSGGHSIADNTSVGVSSGMPATSTYPVNGSGILITGANTGTAQLMFRSETTAVTTLKANTVLIITKIQ